MSKAGRPPTSEETTAPALYHGLAPPGQAAERLLLAVHSGNITRGFVLGRGWSRALPALVTK